MRQKVYYLLSGLIGLLIGWLALGWWLWPVAYVGEAYTYELNQADKLRYASAVVDSFAATGIADPSWFSAWTPEEVNRTMEEVIRHNPARANWARVLANQVSMAQLAQVKTQAQVSESGVFDWLPYLAMAVVVVGLAGAGLWVTRRAALAVDRVESGQTQSIPRYTEMHTAQYVPTRQTTQPLAHAQLTFGPDNPTDQHFPIESRVEGEPTHGEFGVNQVEDQPAWDVWLFDQQALVTVTKVLADQESEELASRGEILHWKEPFTLETPNLKMSGMAVKQLEDGLSVKLTVEAKDEN